MMWWTWLLARFRREDERPVRRLANAILLISLRERADAVYIEPIDGEGRVRLRVNGTYREEMKIPRNITPGLVQELRAMSECNDERGDLRLVLGRNRHAQFDVRPLGFDGIVLTVMENATDDELG